MEPNLRNLEQAFRDGRISRREFHRRAAWIAGGIAAGLNRVREGVFMLTETALMLAIVGLRLLGVRHVRTFAFVVVLAAGGRVAADGIPAVTVTAIAPASASYGESVTVSGNGFGGPNVDIRVGGIPAIVVSATGSRATFRVPTGVPIGGTTVRVTNPGGRSGSIGFDVNGHLTLTLDEAHRVQQLVGAQGGTLTTSSNGRAYTLTIPPGALIKDEAIVMTPVASIAGLPLDAFLGAAHFSPEGLRFANPAILTIGLPPTANTHGLAAFAAAGNGQNLHLTPLFAGEGGTIAIGLSHFSVAGAGTGSPAAVATSVCAQITLECAYTLNLAIDQYIAEQTICGADCVTPADWAAKEQAIEAEWAKTEVPLVREWFTDVLALLNQTGTVDDAGLVTAGHEYQAWQGWVNAWPCNNVLCAALPDVAADIGIGDAALAADYRLAFERAHTACNDRRVSDLMADVLQLGLVGKGGLPSTQQDLQATFACQMIIQASLPPTARPGDAIPFSVQLSVQMSANPADTLPPYNADVTIHVTSGCATIGPPGSTAKTVTQAADLLGNVSTQIQIPTTCVSGGGVTQITVLPQNATVAPGGSIAYTVQIPGGGTSTVVVSVADYFEPAVGVFALGRSATYSTSVPRLATWTAGGGTITPGPATTATYTAGGTAGIFGVTATSVDDPAQSQTVAVTIGNPNPPPPPPPPPTTPLAGTYLGAWTYPLFCNPQPAACSGGVDFGEVYVAQTDSGIGVIQTTGKFRLSFQSLFGACRFEIDVAGGGSFASTGASVGSQCASYLTFSGALTSGHLTLSIFSAGQLAWTFDGSRQ